MKTTIRQDLEKIVKKLYPAAKSLFSQVQVDVPERAEFGDYSTNVAFVLAKAAEGQKTPREIAEVLVAELIKNKDFSRVEMAGAGFINFFVDPSVLEKAVGEILKAKGRYGSGTKNQQNKKSTKQKILVEFLSANPTGPMTLGNGRGGFSGDTLANVLAKSGQDVYREYYVNDAGNQVKNVLTKSVKKQLGLDIQEKEGEEIYHGEYIEYVAGKIKKKKGIDWVEKGKGEVGALAADIILNDFIKKDCKKFGIEYDNWFSEETLFKKKLIEKVWQIIIKDNLVYEQDDAYWLKTTKYGDDKDRVVRTRDGAFTYLMSDIALLYDRFVLRKIKKVIVIVGADHHGYIGRWLASAEILGFGGQLTIIVAQIVRVIRDGEEVKMSKRKGDFVTLDEVVEDIGLDAARYFFISRDFSTHIDIDLELAKEKSNKNPIHYIQYASARMNSVLKKCKVKSVKRKAVAKGSKVSGPGEYELGLIKKMAQFPDLVADVADNFQVHRISTYAYELAGAFHKFYDNCRIIGDDQEGRRVRLVKAAKIVLENTLGIMEIVPKKKM